MTLFFRSNAWTSDEFLDLSQVQFKVYLDDAVAQNDTAEVKAKSSIFDIYKLYFNR